MLGNGAAPKALSMDVLRQRHDGGDGPLMPTQGGLSVTVPGAAALWIDAVEHHGSGMPLLQVLQPAIDLAQEGFSVATITSHHWGNGSSLLKGEGKGDLLLNGQAPKPGQLFKNPSLANTMKLMAQKGKDGFYAGSVAQSIAEAVQQEGGVMIAQDLADHKTDVDSEPLKASYNGIDVYEVPPPTQGIAALLALKTIEGHPSLQQGPGSTAFLHTAIESMRIAFADSSAYTADMKYSHVPVEGLLSQEYIAKRRSLLDPSKAMVNAAAGSPDWGSDTVYFCAVDGKGNGCSMINSNYMGFGTGIVPKGCGFSLQNRGAGFSTEEGHPNLLQPGKRPFHTIIPGLATKDGELWATFGVMGGYMQPQGHLQVLINMLDFGMDPQEALCAPRFCITSRPNRGKVGFSYEDKGDSIIALEEGIAPEVAQALNNMGHDIVYPVCGHERSLFGRGQIIRRYPDTGLLCAGSDPRADGQAIVW